MHPPPVSVVMSVYNGGTKLQATLDSIAAQSYRDYELIIINDGSTDNTSDVLSGYATRDHRIVLFNQENVGLTRSLIRGIELAKGKYIARHDSGDISHPKRFEKQLEFLINNSEVKLLGTAFNIVIDGKIVETVPRPCTYGEILSAMPLYDCFNHGSVMFSREAYYVVGGYREEYKCAQDYELFIRFCKKYAAANLPDVYYDFDIDMNSITFSKLSDQVVNAMIAKYLHYYELNNNSIKLIRSNEVINEILNAYSFWIGVLQKHNNDSATRLISDAINFCCNNKERHKIQLFMKLKIVKDPIKYLRSIKPIKWTD